MHNVEKSLVFQKKINFMKRGGKGLCCAPAGEKNGVMQLEGE
jgi:hypothetical protein